MNDTPRKSSTLRWVLLAAVVIAGGWVLWHKEVRDHFVPRNFGVVEEGVLYRSGRLTPRAIRLLHERHDIKTIVDLGAYDHHPERWELEQRTAESLGVTRYEFRLEGDGTGNPNAYVAALRVLADPANHPVLVHCSAGAERTSGCTMLYHKAVHGRPFIETYPGMTEHKHSPSENPRLMSFLADHGEAILGAFKRGEFIPGFEAFDMKPKVSGYAEANQGEPSKPEAAAATTTNESP